MITVYTKPGCPACVGTIRYLDRMELDYETVDVRESPVARRYIEELGYRSLPVVVAEDGQHWCGLRVERLTALKSCNNGSHSDVIGP